MTRLMELSAQWATRPTEERYVSLTDMLKQLEHERSHSAEPTKSLSDLFVRPAANKTDLALASDKGEAILTNWSFNQLANMAGTSYGTVTRTLPAQLASDVLNYGLQHTSSSDVKLLLSRPNGHIELRAVTSPTYERVWNADIIKSLIKVFGDGTRKPENVWQVPGEFREQIPITNANTTLYCGDRQLFLCLVDESSYVEIPNRRKGQYGIDAKGFMLWNSETSFSTLGITTFTYSYICANRSINGAGNVQKISLRHTKNILDRVRTDLGPALLDYNKASMLPYRNQVLLAQTMRIDQDEITKLLSNQKFGKKDQEALLGGHFQDEERPVETIYDLSNAITAYAQSYKYQDERYEIELKASKILSLAQPDNKKMPALTYNR